MLSPGLGLKNNIFSIRLGSNKSQFKDDVSTKILSENQVKSF